VRAVHDEVDQSVLALMADKPRDDMGISHTRGRGRWR
jgi:hypothetical protein